MSELTQDDGASCDTIIEKSLVAVIGEMTEEPCRDVMLPNHKYFERNE